MVGMDWAGYGRDVCLTAIHRLHREWVPAISRQEHQGTRRRSQQSFLLADATFTLSQEVEVVALGATGKRPTLRCREYWKTYSIYCLIRVSRGLRPRFKRINDCTGRPKTHTLLACVGIIKNHYQALWGARVGVLSQMEAWSQWACSTWLSTTTSHGAHRGLPVFFPGVPLEDHTYLPMEWTASPPRLLRTQSSGEVRSEGAHSVGLDEASMHQLSGVN